MSSHSLCLIASITRLFAFSSLCQCSSTPGYDFIIIGGGTAGLAVANRLTELPQTTVAVIEAGDSVLNNVEVSTVTDFTLDWDTSIDWQYESTNQTYAFGQQIEYHSGKALGGSSTINGMTYVRAQKSQIDAWGALGNRGWNWDSLFPYYLKSEGFEIPTAAQVAAGGTYVAAYHSKNGPLKTGYPYELLNGSFHSTVQDTWRAVGIRHSEDMNGGDVHGFKVWQSTIDRNADVREDAARAYYYPVQRRSNLHVFVNTVVNKITWATGNGDAVASGVEVTFANGTIAIFSARKEVIVSAGALRSPAILELSGIGNPSILSKYGIKTVVNLPAVGENLQDQPNIDFLLLVNETLDGMVPYVSYSTLCDISVPLPSTSLISTWAKSVAAANAVNGNPPISASSLETLFQLQYNILKQNTPDAEVIIESSDSIGLGPTSLVVAAFWVLMPFSRGSVHINSASPVAYPSINPNFFLVNYDLEVQVAIAKFTRKFFAAEPIAGFILEEISPGFQNVPANATDAQWAGFIKSALTANYHPLGTCSMLPRSLGGVVDSSLKVYGTKNVRVVDASIMPLQVSGHLSASVYAIAEKASDLIKAAW